MYIVTCFTCLILSLIFLIAYVIQYIKNIGKHYPIMKRFLPIPIFIGLILISFALIIKGQGTISNIEAVIGVVVFFFGVLTSIIGVWFALFGPVSSRNQKNGIIIVLLGMIMIIIGITISSISFEYTEKIKHSDLRINIAEILTTESKIISGMKFYYLLLLILAGWTILVFKYRPKIPMIIITKILVVLLLIIIYNNFFT